MMELRPLVVNSENMILGGNKRYEALKKLYKEIPETWVRYAESLSSEEQRRFIVADNVNFGEWDYSDLKENWDIEELSEWGLDVPEFDTDIEEKLEAKEDDFEIKDDIKTDIVLGDLFEIGDHRLLCGDSTDSDSVAKLMNGEKSDIVFTSPPYNLGTNVSLSTRGETDNAYKSYNDNQSEEKYNELLEGFTNSFWQYCRYLIVNIQSLAGNKKSVIDYQHTYKDNISDIAVWVKSNPQPAMAKNVMNSAFEYFIFINTGDNVTRAINTGDFRGTFSNVYYGTVNNENEVKQHKAAFSSKMCGEFIKTFSKKSVIDCFLGTGTTMVASHQLKRKCYGMELDPKYCQVIIDRMKKLDSTLIIKKNGVVM
jgi:DNA modification methylase